MDNYVKTGKSFCRRTIYCILNLYYLEISPYTLALVLKEGWGLAISKIIINGASK